MKIFEHIEDAQRNLKSIKEKVSKVGFVPTMGALHDGHLSLVRRAAKENDYVVASIFVNPIQFNNKEDLINYPRDIDSDVAKLRAEGCDMLFMPSTEEMYPEPVTTVYDLGHLDKVMEGKYRPGHFNGVVVVVRKLFEIIEPDRAYFGEKDYQQLVIIQYMTKMLHLPVEIIPCPTVREKDGLAMSSRNARLTKKERQIAPQINKILNDAKVKAAHSTVEGLKRYVEIQFKKTDKLNLEYFEIADMNTLIPVDSWEKRSNIIACVAVYLGGIRLIDNIKLFS
jgi:pantoate--beta-alanine ligase